MTPFYTPGMAYAVFALVSLIWGSSFILMKVALGVFGPVSLGGWRALGGAMALGVVWWVRRERITGTLKKKHLPRLGIPILIGMAYPWWLQPHLIGKHDHSALFGMMIGLVPLLTIVVSIPLLRVLPKARQVVGVLIGLGCLASLVGVGGEIGVPAIDVLWAATVPSCYALSNTYIKRGFMGVDPVILTSVTLGVTSVILLPLGFALEPVKLDALDTVPGGLPGAIGALVVLGVLGTGGATLMFFWMVQKRGPLFAGMVAYLVPIGAVAWGWVDGEKVGLGQVLALAGILAGVALVQWPGKRRAVGRVAWKRLIAAVVLTPVLFTLVWWGIGRVTSPWRAVQVINEPAWTSHTSPAETTSDTLLIAAYNIAHGRGLSDSNWHTGDRPMRLLNIAELLRGLDADVVVLNEVDFDATWSGGVNQAALIAEHAGYPHRVEQRSFDMDLPGFRLKFGNAVLSRHPVVRAEPLKLPAHKRWEAVVAGSKQAAACVIRLPDGREAVIVPIHLEHRSEPTRIAAVEPLLSVLRQHPNTPVVLAGDFNSTLPGLPGAKPNADGNTALSMLLNQGLTTPTPNRPPTDVQITFPSDEPSRIIDWVLINRVPKDIQSRAIDTTLSDHRPVVADITLRPTP